MKKNSGENPVDRPFVRPEKSLYLARALYGASPRYFFRQTCRDEESGLLSYRQIFDLGDNPRRFIVSLGGHGYCVDDRVIDAIRPFVAGDAGEMAEDLLWPFVDKDVRDKLEPFRSRGRQIKISPLSVEERAAIAGEIHEFDRRRLHYLWYGSIDQSGLHRMPDKLCRRLLGKSRDEKEQFFISREQVFHADEIKQYLYAVFNLQRHFSESFARIMPQGLNEEKLDACFVDALCCLNRDPELWQEMAETDRLQPYLIRYLILFFDYDFGASQALNDYIRQFINSHRTFGAPLKSPTVSMDAASSIFGETKEKLAGLSKKELTKLYRRKAKELHPDIGGEHDEFVRLTEAFEELLRRR